MGVWKEHSHHERHNGNQIEDYQDHARMCSISDCPNVYDANMKLPEFQGCEHPQCECGPRCTVCGYTFVVHEHDVCKSELCRQVQCVKCGTANQSVLIFEPDLGGYVCPTHYNNAYDDRNESDMLKCKQCQRLLPRDQVDGKNICLDCRERYYRVKCFNIKCNRELSIEEQDLGNFCFECDKKIREGRCTSCDGPAGEHANHYGHCERCQGHGIGKSKHICPGCNNEFLRGSLTLPTCEDCEFEVASGRCVVCGTETDEVDEFGRCNEECSTVPEFKCIVQGCTNLVTTSGAACAKCVMGGVGVS